MKQNRPSSDTPQASYQKSIYARVEYIKSIISNPIIYQEDREVIGLLKSQSGLAKLDRESLGITPMSLNTLKSRADELLTGGFTAINTLRLKALQSLAEPIDKPTRTDSKKNLLMKIGAHKNETLALRDDIALLNSCLLESMKIAQEFAEKCSDSKEISLFKKRRKELLIMLSVRGLE